MNFDRYVRDDDVERRYKYYIREREKENKRERKRESDKREKREFWPDADLHKRAAKSVRPGIPMRKPLKSSVKFAARLEATVVIRRHTRAQAHAQKYYTNIFI